MPAPGSGVDLTGQRFGRLIVDSQSGRQSRHGVYWLCVCDCGAIVRVNRSALTRGNTRSCGCLRREVSRAPKPKGDAHPLWAGGPANHGYVRTRDPEGRRILEHRLVMEQRLGRKLADNENVHHLNGDRKDNRPENLELWNTTQPKGQRPEDKVAWAVELLAQYAPHLLAPNASAAIGPK